MSTTYYTPPIGPSGVGNNDYGERWGDALGNVEQTRRRGFVSENYRDTNTEVEFIKHNQVSYMDGAIQFDHDYILDSEIRLHVHHVPMANASGDVRFEWQYTFAIPGHEVPAVASWTTGHTILSLTAGDQYKHKADTLFTLTPSGAAPSSILLFQVSRNTSHADDTYTTDKDHGTAAANLGILYFDAHYRKGSPGTATEWV